MHVSTVLESSGKAKRKIFLLTFGSLTVLTVYFTLANYYQFLLNSEKEALEKLQSIASTLSLQIDGSQHASLIRRYKDKDAIATSGQDTLYQQLHRQLLNAHNLNNLQTDIYTLFIENGKVYFGVTSGERPYFRHSYTIHPKELLVNFSKGGMLGKYRDEHGTWLSAFAPVRMESGETMAVVQADQQFDDFIAAANKKLIFNAGISFLIISGISLVLYRSLRVIITNEENMIRQLEESSQLIAKRNKDISQSINYARRITDAVMVSPEYIRMHIPDSFVIFKPRDVVSGDFYWFYPLKICKNSGLAKKFLIGVFDCTGHGIPGAFLSVMGMSLLNEIARNAENNQPGLILEQLNRQLIELLKQHQQNTILQDGMDAALCLVDLESLTLEYAGAGRPLYLVRQENTTAVEEIKGDKFPLGGTHYAVNRKFSNHSLLLTKGDKAYMFSDGYVDQFGMFDGKERKIMVSSLKKLFLQLATAGMAEQKDAIEQQFGLWKGELKQIDDVTVVALAV